MARWYLEGFLDQGHRLQRIPIHGFPFTVGRNDDRDLPLNATDVSRQHAELFEQDNRLYLRDLGSTNGTFLNHHRIQGETPLDGGDVVHFAHLEFRVVDDLPPETQSHIQPEIQNTMLVSGALPDRMPMGVRELKEMLATHQLGAVFQPIVNPQSQIVGYEALGRGAHPQLPQGPGPLFRIAESIDLAGELSERFRDLSLRIAANANVSVPILVNTHPQELEFPAKLLHSLERMRLELPDLPLILEIHEEAVTNLAAMQRLSADLKSLRIGLAYDDFGAGQARLLELTDAPPDIVKFDIALIRNLDKAPPNRLEMVKMLVDMVHRMGVKALAEGIDSAGEAQVCTNLGFDLFQGFYFGRPSPMQAGSS